jgi:glucokinase
MALLTAGVDLGGTKIQTVVVRGEKVVGESRAPTPQASAETVMAAIAESVRAAARSAGADVADVGAVGIGSPGTIDQKQGTVANSANVPGFAGISVPLAAEVARALGGIAVRLDNDVRVAVLGEWKRGAGRPYQDLMGVFVGTGVGGGLVLANQLRVGRGAAGEIGHTKVRVRGRKCSCGRRGCLEAYAGRAQIEAAAQRRLERGRPTRLFEIMRARGRDRVTSGVIADALAAGDEVTVALIKQAVQALGLALANAQNLLDLDAIIVGGGLGDRLGRSFVERVEAAARPHLHVPERPPAFLPTELGDLAGAVGAAVLAGG